MNKDNVKWYFNRIRAMSIKEIGWRINQKILEKYEYICFNKRKVFINEKIKGYTYNKYINFYCCDRAPLNYENKNYSINYNDCFWNKYYYEINDINTWNYGFQTNNKWNMDFAYNLKYKQNDIIGDARTNWEVNRHFHLSQMAKLYYVTRESKYSEKLEKYFYDWNKNNPFLKGIAWTSVMEVSIRSISWLIVLSFLEKAKYKNKKFLKDLKISILNSTEYTSKHYSKYSSANNHLIIEMINIGIVGISFNIDEWIELSKDTLEYEMLRQNYHDGVNKEQSPHYQSFVMEGIFLYIITCKKNNVKYPQRIISTLEKMCEYISDLSNCKDNIPNLGDSDEGKVIDLSGWDYNHYKYVLELGSYILQKKYTSLDNLCENTEWIIGDLFNRKFNISYDNSKSRIYKDGGISILKFKENNIERFMTFDHGELGFGSIAAHGHADSLSITLSVDGEDIFIDPGTYIYHIMKPWRDYFRKTINHNTIEINSKDQSEMKGAFLWGKRANSKLINSFISDKKDNIVAIHDGYKPISHTRNIQYYKPDIFIIKDSVEGDFSSYKFSLIIDDSLELKSFKDKIIIYGKKNNIYIKFLGSESIIIEDIWISKRYSYKEKSKVIRVINNKSNILTTIISINIEITDELIEEYNN